MNLLFILFYLFKILLFQLIKKLINKKITWMKNNNTATGSWNIFGVFINWILTISFWGTFWSFKGFCKLIHRSNLNYFFFKSFFEFLFVCFFFFFKKYLFFFFVFLNQNNPNLQVEFLQQILIKYLNFIFIFFCFILLYYFIFIFLFFLFAYHSEHIISIINFFWNRIVNCWNFN